MLSIDYHYIFHIDMLKCVLWLDTHSVNVWWRYELTIKNTEKYIENWLCGSYRTHIASFKTCQNWWQLDRNCDLYSDNRHSPTLTYIYKVFLAVRSMRNMTPSPVWSLLLYAPCEYNLYIVYPLVQWHKWTSLS